MKRTLTIENTTQSAVMEKLDEFFNLEFRSTRDCDIYVDNGSILAREVFRTSPLLLVVHIVLTLVTLGLWLVVWVLIELVQRGQREKVEVALFPIERSPSEVGTVEVRLSGTDGWVQTTKAYIGSTFDTHTSEV